MARAEAWDGVSEQLVLDLDTPPPEPDDATVWVPPGASPDDREWFQAGCPEPVPYGVIPYRR